MCKHLINYQEQLCMVRYKLPTLEPAPVTKIVPSPAAQSLPYYCHRPGITKAAKFFYIILVHFKCTLYVVSLYGTI